MRKTIAAALVTLVILAATYGMFLVWFSPDGKQTPRVENGLLDLTACRFADKGIVPLDGEWEFYPDKLLFHEDFTSSPRMKTIVCRGGSKCRARGRTR